MFEKRVKQLCEAHNFRMEKKFAYGEVNGYLITISEKMGLVSFYINCVFDNEDLEPKVKQIQQFMKQSTKLYPKPTYRFDRFGVEANFYDNYKFVKSAENFFTEVTGFLKSIGVDGVERCCLCGEPMQNRTPKRINRNGHVLNCDGSCADAAVRGLAENSEVEKVTSRHYCRGTVGAILGTLIGIIPWIIVYMWGYFVGWLGALIAVCARKGYELLGGRAGRVKALIVIVVTLLAVVLAQFISICFELRSEAINQEIALSLSELIGISFQLIKEDEEVQRYFIGNLFMGFLFALLGLWDVIRSIFQESKEINAKITILEQSDLEGQSFVG